MVLPVFPSLEEVRNKIGPSSVFGSMDKNPDLRSPLSVTGDPFLDDVLGGDPEGRRLLFESFIPQDVIGQQRRALSSLFEPTFNQYLGTLAQDPSRRFSDFLETDFDANRERARLPGSVGGFNTGSTIFRL